MQFGPLLGQYVYKGGKRVPCGGSERPQALEPVTPRTGVTCFLFGGLLSVPKSVTPILGSEIVTPSFEKLRI